jgi:hypothetical protein
MSVKALAGALYRAGLMNPTGFFPTFALSELMRVNIAATTGELQLVPSTGVGWPLSSTRYECPLALISGKALLFPLNMELGGKLPDCFFKYC